MPTPPPALRLVPGPLLVWSPSHLVDGVDHHGRRTRAALGRAAVMGVGGSDSGRGGRADVGGALPPAKRKPLPNDATAHRSAACRRWHVHRRDHVADCHRRAAEASVRGRGCHTNTAVLVSVGGSDHGGGGRAVGNGAHSPPPQTSARARREGGGRPRAAADGGGRHTSAAVPPWSSGGKGERNGGEGESGRDHHHGYTTQKRRREDSRPRIPPGVYWYSPFSRLPQRDCGPKSTPASRFLPQPSTSDASTHPAWLYARLNTSS